MRKMKKAQGLIEWTPQRRLLVVGPIRIKKTHRGWTIDIDNRSVKKFGTIVFHPSDPPQIVDWEIS